MNLNINEFELNLNINEFELNLDECELNINAHVDRHSRKNRSRKILINTELVQNDRSSLGKHSHRRSGHIQSGTGETKKKHHGDPTSEEQKKKSKQNRNHSYSERHFAAI